MNADRLIRMVSRMIMRRVVNRGVDAGIDMATRRRGDAEPESEADRRRAASAKDTARRARKAAKLTRRLGRF